MNPSQHRNDPASMRFFAETALLFAAFLSAGTTSAATLPLTVNRAVNGALVTFGVPFPKGVLKSPDQVRVLNARGLEVESQITEVNSWLPASDSVQWIWVDFIADGSNG